MFTLFAVQSDDNFPNTFDNNGFMPSSQHGRSDDRGRAPLIWTIGRPLRFARVVKLTRRAGFPAGRQLARRNPANRQWEAVKPPVDVPARAPLAELRPGNPWATECIRSGVTSLLHPYSDGSADHASRNDGTVKEAGAQVLPDASSCSRESSVAARPGTCAKVKTTADRSRRTSIWTLQNSRGQGPKLNIISAQGKALPCSESSGTMFLRA